MAQQQPSKKWVDYSDESDQEQNHHKVEEQKNIQKNKNDQNQKIDTHKIQSKEQIDRKLEDLERIQGNFVWLTVTCEDKQHLKNEMKELAKTITKTSEVVQIFEKKESNCYEVEVVFALAEDWIKYGYQYSNQIKVDVAEYNFTAKKSDKKKTGPKTYNKSTKFQQKYEKQDDQEKVYIDKESGKQVKKKKKFTEKPAEENERKYDKNEAAQKGKELGNFRSKELKSETNEKAEGKEAPPAQQSKIKVEENKKAEKNNSNKNPQKKSNKATSNNIFHSLVADDSS